MKSGEKPAKSREKKVKSREKIIALLSQGNTLSAAALAQRIRIPPKAVEKTDCQAESGRSAPTNRAGQRRILASGRKNGFFQKQFGNKQNSIFFLLCKIKRFNS